MLKTATVVALAAAAACAVHAAEAGFTVCNETGIRTSVAVGFLDPEAGWTAEGWWNVEPHECAVTVGPPLVGDYVYVVAEGNRGSWTARPGQQAGYFCVLGDSFITRNIDFEDADGVLDCGDYETRQFREIDTRGRANVRLRLSY